MERARLRSSRRRPCHDHREDQSSAFHDNILSWTVVTTTPTVCLGFRTSPIPINRSGRKCLIYPRSDSVRKGSEESGIRRSFPSSSLSLTLSGSRFAKLAIIATTAIRISFLDGGVVFANVFDGIGGSFSLRRQCLVFSATVSDYEKRSRNERPR